MSTFTPSPSIPHPHGILPLGNLYCAQASPVLRKGLLLTLSDSILLDVISYFDCRSLGQWCCCGRISYLFGMGDEVWRDCFLRWLISRGGDGSDTKEDDTIEDKSKIRKVKTSRNHLPSAILNFGFVATGWRDTFSKRVLALSNSALNYKPHSPLQNLPALYSEELYRPHLCAHFTFPSDFLRDETVDRRKLCDLGVGVFERDYEEKNVPVVILGGSECWPCVRDWGKVGVLVNKTNTNTNSTAAAECGSKSAPPTFRATSGKCSIPVEFTLSTYLEYARCQRKDEAPLYFFDRDFVAKCPQLGKDYQSELKKTCPFFCTTPENPSDLFSLLGSDKRPDHKWLIIGPQRSGSSFHIDPNCTHAWNCPIIGRKKWIFYPPGHPPPGVIPSSDGDDVAMPISLGEWVIDFWKEHVKRKQKLKREGRWEEMPLECVVSPGDILFVPHGWWHTVINLEEEEGSPGEMMPNIALTQNYVSKSNLPDAFRFLRNKISQISGCRDRAEAVDPELFFEEFKAKVFEYDAELARDALERSDKGWECNAWKDEVKKAAGDIKVGPSILDKAKEDVESGAGGFCFNFD